MTRIDFYILQSDTQEAWYDFSCKLIEKAAKQGNAVVVLTDDAEGSETLDSLLWRFKPESFVPHAIWGKQEAEDRELPVIISHAEIPNHINDVMINLSKDIPEDFSRFSRFAQVVNQNRERLSASRKHFAFFKERDYAIEVNKLNR